MVIDRERPSPDTSNLKRVVVKNEWLASIADPASRRDYEQDIAEFAHFQGIEKTDDFRLVTRAHIVAWRNQLMQSALDPASIRRKYWALGKLFDDFAKDHFITRDPVNIDYEASVRRVYETLLHDGNVAIDVGAHVGSHTFPIAQALAPAGKVYAIEPLPGCRGHFNHLLETNHPDCKKNIELLDCALADYDGNAEFVVAVQAPWLSGLQKRIYDVPTALEKIPVQVHTFDSLFLSLPRIDYVKVDAEGGEYHIFKGAEKCLAKFRPLVTFEFGEIAIGNYNITIADMADFWFTHDYILYDIDGHLLRRRDDFIKCAEIQLVWDFVCIPQENKQLDLLIQEALRS